MNSHKIARVAARLLNVYNSCIDWRELHAERDLMKFLLAATLVMLSGYKTSNDVLKQVSHRGAIRMPAYMVKGQMQTKPIVPIPQSSVRHDVRMGTMVSARFDGSTDCSGMEEMSHTMTT